MKKKKLLKLDISVDPYPVNLVYYRGPGEMFAKEMKKKYNMDLVTDCKGYFLDFEDGNMVIWTEVGSIYHIIHECLHAVEGIMEFISQAQLDEPGAYLMEYLVKKCKEVG